MKRIYLSMLVAFVLLPGLGIAQEVDSPFAVLANGENIHASPNYTGPALVDWDRDGIQDMIVGMFGGEFRFYKNHGSNSKPEFKDFTNIEAGGEEATIPNW